MAHLPAGPAAHHLVRGRALSGPAAPARRLWLDWARGLAVGLMVLAHVVDAWTRDADRDRTAFYWATFVGGLAAPAFLFLAGLGSALSGAAKRRAGMPRAAVTRALLRRGAVIFGLALLFRVQALALGWGHPIDVLKVDILNVMGPALMAAALLWGLADGAVGRVAVAAAATGALAMAAPLLRTAAWIDLLPDPLQWYWRPTPGHTNFTLVPWSGFVFAGLGAGAALAATRDAAGERRLQLVLAMLAAFGGGVAWWASFQPTIYAPGQSSFWGASPAFFFLRLALVTAILPLAWSLRHRLPAVVAAPLATLGGASLFVYWVHVELVYGGVAIPLKHRLPLEVALAATLALAGGMSRLVPWTRRWVVAPDRPPRGVKRLVARLL
ncbi:MAG: heparan-alpha-glucosaminide N-acetyltransferase domain-containing protein [Vicinamibacterales bacterium]